MANQWSKDIFCDRQVFSYWFVPVTADKGSDRLNSQSCSGINTFDDMCVDFVTTLLIGVQIVIVKSNR